jgi:hypothetical protein
MLPLQRIGARKLQRRHDGTRTSYITVLHDRVARLAFLKLNSRNLFFLIWLASQNSFGFLAFSYAKIICTKISYHPFSKSFSFKKMFFGQLHLAVFLPPRVWARRRQPATGKLAEHGGYVTRLRTVAPVISALRSVWM